ncbi:Unknown protein [Striga hermonthica]|uniref:KIB1-4 beta-propeller domain-containing protein n=1 Tax=Striga hermonthica TaxID=68872 RepID=A0A9N7MLI5_STRHE|nr:Unknown protein [Striga hermonthica]
MELEMKENNEKLPLLMTVHGNHPSRQSFYSLVDRQCKKTQLPILIPKRIIGSGHGWLVLVNILTGKSCLWNPESMRQVSLPFLRDAHMYSRCVLTGPPTEPDCHLIFCSLNEEEWTVFRVRDCTTVSSPPGEVQIAAMASYRGEMYGLVDTDDRGFEFVTVHVVEGGLEFRPLLDELGRTEMIER